jgi:DNA-binding response OmpR family regulator
MSKKKRVLLIDDEVLLVKSTLMALRYYDFEVEGAYNGPDGLLKALDGADVILLDIMMPGMDGWEVLKKLKESEKTKNIPVIIFTAMEYADGNTTVFRRGGDDYVAKPFDLEELVETIKKHV